LFMDDSVLAPSSCARNLGVIFDTHLTLDSQIKSITKSAFHNLLNIARIGFMHIKAHGAEKIKKIFFLSSFFVLFLFLYYLILSK